MKHTIILVLTLASFAASLPASENEVIGQKFKVKFEDGYKAELFFTMTTVVFRAEGDELEVPVKVRNVGGGFWLAQWLEDKDTHVTLFMDLENGKAHSSVYSQSKKREEPETWFQKGSLKKIEAK